MARMQMDCILKKWGYRFQVYTSVSENSLQFWLWFIFSCKFTWYLPFSVRSVFFVRKRYVDLIWGHFDLKAWKSPWRSPCKSSYFGKNDSFYQLFLKKNDFGQNTQLWVGFAKIKSFHSLNTQFWAVFEKKLTPLVRKQKIHECLLKEARSPFLALL